MFNLGDFGLLPSQLQPRRPTTGTIDFLHPLQPEILGKHKI